MMPAQPDLRGAGCTFLSYGIRPRTGSTHDCSGASMSWVENSIHCSIRACMHAGVPTSGLPSCKQSKQSGAQQHSLLLSFSMTSAEVVRQTPPLQSGNRVAVAHCLDRGATEEAAV